MVGANIEFDFATVTDENRFIRDYLVDAWDRFETSDFFETGWFWRYGPYNQYRGDSVGGLVRIVFEGEPEMLIEAEKSHWDKSSDITDWRAKKGKGEDDTLLAQQQIASGEQIGKIDYQLKPLVARFILDYYRTFPNVLPMIPENRSGPEYGYWVALHYFVVLAGYDRHDEIVGAFKMMQNRLESIAKYHGSDRAREEHQRLLQAWQAYGEDLDTWIEKNPTGQNERVNLIGDT